MKKVAAMIRSHFNGIVNWTRTRQTSGSIEAIMGLFQAAKTEGARVHPVRYYETVIFLIAGKLNFAAFNPHVANQPKFNRAKRPIFDVNNFLISKTCIRIPATATALGAHRRRLHHHAAGALHQKKLEIDVFGCAIVGNFRAHARDAVAQTPLQ
jgi:hypothetical protein